MVTCVPRRVEVAMTIITPPAGWGEGAAAASVSSPSPKARQAAPWLGLPVMSVLAMLAGRGGFALSHWLCKVIDGWTKDWWFPFRLVTAFAGLVPLAPIILLTCIGVMFGLMGPLMLPAMVADYVGAPEGSNPRDPAWVRARRCTLILAILVSLATLAASLAIMTW